jgi:WD40 repeat protein
MDSRNDIQLADIDNLLNDVDLQSALSDVNSLGDTTHNQEVEKIESQLKSVFDNITKELRLPTLEGEGYNSISIISGKLQNFGCKNEKDIDFINMLDPEVEQIFADIKSYEICLFIIKASAYCPDILNINKAAAVAITRLNVARVSFSSLNLRNIKIPHANLEHAVFDNTDLQGANLEYTFMRNIFLRNARLQGASLQNIDFGVKILHQQGSISCIEFSPNGEWLVIASDPNRVSVWNIPRDIMAWEKVGIVSNVASLAFSPDSEWMAIGGWKVVVIFDKSGNRQSVKECHADIVTSLAFVPPQGELLITGSKDNTIGIWELKCNGFLAKLMWFNEEIIYIGLKQDEKQIIVRKKNSLEPVSIFQFNGLSEFRPLAKCSIKERAQEIRQIKFSPSGKSIVINKKEDKSDDVQNILFSPDENFLLVNLSKEIKIWDLQKNKPIVALRVNNSVTTVAAFMPISNPEEITIVIGIGSMLNKWEIKLTKELATSKVTKLLFDYGSEITQIKSAADGWLAIGCADGSVYILSSLESKPSKKIKQMDKIISEAFSSDGTLLATASASNDKTVYIWHKCSEKLSMLEIYGYGNEVIDLNFSKDRRLLTSVSANKRIRIWDVDSGRELVELQRDVTEIYDVYFGLDGGLLLAESVKDEIFVSKIRLTVPPQELSLTKEFSEIREFGLSFDGKLFAAGFKKGNEGKAIFGYKNGAAENLPFIELKDSADILTADTDIKIAPNLHLCAAADRVIRVWDLQSKQVFLKFPGNAVMRILKFSPDSNLLVSGDAIGNAYIWNLVVRKQIISITHHKGKVTAVCFSPDDKILATGGEDHKIYLWNVTMGGKLIRLGGSLKDGKDAHNGGICSLVFPFQDELFSGGTDYEIHRWGRLAETKKTLLSKYLGDSWITDLSFSAQNGKLSFSCSNGKVYIIDIKTFKVADKNIHQHAKWATSVSFSKDGNYLASGSEDKSIYVSHLGENTLKKLTLGHNAVITSVSFSHNTNEILASGGDDPDNTIRIWQVKTRKQLIKLEGHLSGVTKVCFGPLMTLENEGNYELLASASRDKTVRLWCWKSVGNQGECLSILEGHTDEVESMSFAANDKLLATGSKDGTCRIWDVSVPKETKCLNIIGSFSSFFKGSQLDNVRVTEATSNLLKQNGAVGDPQKMEEKKSPDIDTAIKQKSLDSKSQKTEECLNVNFFAKQTILSNALVVYKTIDVATSDKIESFTEKSSKSGT